MIRLGTLIVFLSSWLLPAYAQTMEDLQRAVKERDAKIRELQQRLQAADQAPDDDDELNRALERTLVQQGAMVLSSGRFELSPQLSYAHWDTDRSTFRDEWDGVLSFRGGFGRGWQAQVAVPYVHLSTASDSGSGLGDISLSLSKELRREGGLWPGVLASVGWLARTGNDGLDGGVPTGGGFNVLQTSVTATKRADPLVYFAGLSYSLPQPREVAGARLEPGKSSGLRGGAVLAATPYTSVNAGLNLAFVGAARVDGQRISDSDTTLGTLQLGLSSILTGRVMLNLSGEFRVSGPVPNFRLTIAFPIRF